MEFLGALEPFTPVAIFVVVLLIVRRIAGSAKEMDVSLPGGGSIKSKQAGGIGTLDARLRAARRP